MSSPACDGRSLMLMDSVCGEETPQSRERERGVSELRCGNYYAISTDSILKFGFSGV